MVTGDGNYGRPAAVAGAGYGSRPQRWWQGTVITTGQLRIQELVNGDLANASAGDPKAHGVLSSKGVHICSCP